jgi:hypothetical protein
MTYAVTGLAMTDFVVLFALDDAELAEHRAVRVRADADRGFPCRVSLEDAKEGEELILVHHVSHEVETPYRTAHAVYVRADAIEPAPFIDAIPPVFERRTLSLRGFDGDHMLRSANLAAPGEADAAIRALFADDTIAYIHAHNAAPGCFAARIDRN